MWKIRYDEPLDKKLAKLKPNGEVVKGFKSAVENLAQSADPASMGARKRGRLRGMYSYRITKSFRLLYSVNYDEGKITLVDLDDHKNLYGRG